jgi:hypothetical protein
VSTVPVRHSEEPKCVSYVTAGKFGGQPLAISGLDTRTSGYPSGFSDIGSPKSDMKEWPCREPIGGVTRRVTVALARLVSTVTGAFRLPYPLVASSLSVTCYPTREPLHRSAELTDNACRELE